MIKLKLAGLTCLLLIPLTGVTTFAILSLPVTGETMSNRGIDDVIICPCPPPLDDGGTGSEGRKRDKPDNFDSVDNDSDADSGDNSDDDNNDDDNNDSNCDHSNKCPVCDDCIDCGNDPCTECCDEGRRCDDCILCTFDIGMVDGHLQYTGVGLLSFEGGTINKGHSDEGFWEYRYSPVSGTGAQLDAAGLPLRVGQYQVTGTYDNGRYYDSKTSILTVTPAPLDVTVTLENQSKVYDGTTDISGMTAELTGIIGNDIVEFSEYGIPSYVSPDAGSQIVVVFSDFEISGTHAWNYFLIQPENLTACITRAPYEGIISVVINDDPLRIGTELTFKATGDPPDYLVQWRVDGEDIDDADDITYIVTPDDADKKISVAVVSPCRNYEGVSPPTDYVPYTIRVLLGETALPMENDDVFFGTQGNDTTYAASKNNGLVFIDYYLQDSGFGTDSIEYSGGDVDDVSGAGSGISEYSVDPDDAVNGEIVITATAYHRGVSVSPVGWFVFEPVECDTDTAETYTITISQLGNAPTGAIYIDKQGDYPYEYAISTSFIPSIDIGSTYELEISTNLGSSPPGLEGYTFNAIVDITGDNISDHTVPVSVRVEHNFSELEYRGGFHDHYCIGCKFYSDDKCNYNSWIGHSRSCIVCKGVNSHPPSWTAWVHGTAERHSRTCDKCDLDDTDPHNWGNWGAWTQGDATNHSRTGSCTICTRPGGSNTAAHTWGGWGAWSNTNATIHTRSRTCSTCSRSGSETASHSFSAWSIRDGSTHSRNCSSCGRLETPAHNYITNPNPSYVGYHIFEINNSVTHSHGIHICGTCSYVLPSERIGSAMTNSGFCAYNAANICIGTMHWIDGAYRFFQYGCGRPWQVVPGYSLTNINYMP